MGMLVLYCNRIVLYDNNTMTGRSPVRGADPCGAEPLTGLRPVRGGAPGSIFLLILWILMDLMQFLLS